MRAKLLDLVRWRKMFIPGCHSRPLRAVLLRPGQAGHTSALAGEWDGSIGGTSRIPYAGALDHET